MNIRNGAAMCEKCIEIDEKIERFKRITERFTDDKLIDGIAAAIAEMEAERAALHPDEE